MNLNEHIEEKIKELDAEFEECGAVRHESLVAAFRELATASLEAGAKEALAVFEEEFDKYPYDVNSHTSRNALIRNLHIKVLAAISEQKKKAEEYLKP